MNNPSSNPFRTKQIRRSLLQALSYARGYPLEDSALRTHVSDLQRPPLSDKEWEITVAWMLDDGQAVFVENEADAAMRQYAITERGRTLLATL